MKRMIAIALLLAGCASDAEEAEKYRNAPEGSIAATCKSVGIQTASACRAYVLSGGSSTRFGSNCRQVTSRNTFDHKVRTSTVCD